MCIRDRVASGTQVQQAPVHSSPSSVTTQAANGTTAQHPQASAAVQPGAPASPGAVSYTHLDVYKRQGLSAVNLLCNDIGRSEETYT